jgi:hypothetical protein
MTGGVQQARNRGDEAIRRLSRSEPITRVLAAGGRGWPPPGDRSWAATISLAARSRLLAAVWCEGVARGALTPVSAAVRAAIAARLSSAAVVPELVLQDAYENSRERLGRQLAAWEVVDLRLREAGIRALPLKGLHTVLDGWWADPAARMMTDLDVLVRAGEASAADRILAELGFVLAPANDWADHHLPQRWLEDEDVCIELHTSLSTARVPQLLRAPEALAEAAGRGRLTTTHATVHLIAHAQLQHEGHRLGQFDLARLYDLAAVSGGPRAAEIDWAEVRWRFASAGAGAALRRWLVAARAVYAAELPAPPARPGDLLAAAVAGLRLEGTALGRAQFYALKAPERFSAERMIALYGPGPIWRRRLAHAVEHRPRSR